MPIHVTIFLVFAFGLLAGFYLCLFTLVDKAIAIAKECVETEKKCLALVHDAQDALKDWQFFHANPKPKTGKELIH